MGAFFMKGGAVIYGYGIFVFLFGYITMMVIMLWHSITLQILSIWAITEIVFKLIELSEKKNKNFGWPLFIVTYCCGMMASLTSMDLDAGIEQTMTFSFVDFSLCLFASFVLIALLKKSIAHVPLSNTCKVAVVVFAIITLAIQTHSMLLCSLAVSFLIGYLFLKALQGKMVVSTQTLSLLVSGNFLFLVMPTALVCQNKVIGSIFLGLQLLFFVGAAVLLRHHHKTFKKGEKQ